MAFHSGFTLPWLFQALGLWPSGILMGAQGASPVLQQSCATVAELTKHDLLATTQTQGVGEKMSETQRRELARLFLIFSG